MSSTNNIYVKYDYYDTTIKNQYEKDIENNGYIKIPYYNNKSIIQPNLILSNNDKYKIINLYINKKSLNLDNIDYDGELIIEHTNITNNDNKFYLCILLKTQPSVQEETVIDKIIRKSFSNEINININNFLNVMNPSSLVNKDNTIIIIKKPLLISSSFNEFSNVENVFFHLFNKYDLKTIQIQHIHSTDATNDSESFTENFIEGADVFMDCSPVDSSETTVSMVPVNSDNLLNPSTVIFMSTIQNFFIFIVLVGIIVTVVPNIYKHIIMEFINNNYNSEPNKNSYLIVFDYIILFVLFFVSFIVLGTGVSKNNKVQSSIGIYLFICSTLALVTMIIFKIMNKDYYNFVDDIDSIGQKSGSFIGKLIEILMDIIKRFIAYFIHVFSDGNNLIFLLIFELIVLFISHYSFNYDITDTKGNGGYYFFITIVVIFLSMITIKSFNSDL